ncbi:MAG TPA: DUF2785 domain-containing protein [Spirochaetales bacterium]|nr:DUF2785 domain-containing protein [Spirochaetales bacterium]HRY54928.1 DUF2785 domain-containing protein [Spirochaetia bacterium]HRZ65274.1 DUF2785 domain-containing protein [Spirochaetia bacterium]
MRTKEDLVRELEAIKARAFAFPPGGELEPLVEEMLSRLGDPDGYLRDDLIYEAFAAWIPAGRLPEGTVRGILEACLSDRFLRWRIGEAEGDGVFTRSFSMLLVALVLELDGKAPFLDRGAVARVFERVCGAYADENDLEGYIPGKGWAHSVAHTADVFALLAGRPELGLAELGELLVLIRAKFLGSGRYLRDNEDERTAAAIAPILRRGEAGRELVSAWLPTLVAYERPEDIPRRQVLRGNARNLLRSLYFAVDDPGIRAIAESLLRRTRF